MKYTHNEIVAVQGELHHCSCVEVPMTDAVPITELSTEDRRNAEFSQRFVDCWGCPDPSEDLEITLGDFGIVN